MRYTIQIEAEVPLIPDVLDRISEVLADGRRDYGDSAVMVTADPKGTPVTVTFEVDTPTVTSAVTAAVDACREILVDATAGCRIMSICATADPR